MRKSRLIILAAGLLGIGFSFAAYYLTANLEQKEQEILFEHAASSIVFSVESYIASNIEVVTSTASFFEVSSYVSRDKFNAFVSPSLKKYTGIQALEWIPLVPDSERDAFRRKAIEDGFPDFQIKEKGREGGLVPAATRPKYFPVYYVSPYKGNESALGFDLASNVSRLQALTLAHATGKTVTTAPISLVQEKGKQSGVLIITPIFSNHLSQGINNSENFKGFSLGVYRVGDMIREAIKQQLDDGPFASKIDLYVFDQNAPPQTQLLHAGAASLRKTPIPRLTLGEATQGPHLIHRIKMGERTWTLVTRPFDPALIDPQSPIPIFVLIGGLMFTTLLLIHLVNQMNRNTIVETQVLERTALLDQQRSKLQRSEARSRAILNNTVDGIITIDKKGMVRSINRAAKEIFGYSEREVIGQNVKMLMPSPYQAEHDGYLNNYDSGGCAKIIGIGREVEGKRKNGDVFPMDLAVGEVRIDDEVSYTGIVRDITERKNIELMKNEFVSTVSHELRTPLTSIVGSLGLLKTGKFGAMGEQADKMVKIALSNSERLVRLINDILDIEKIEAGKLEFNMAPLSLKALVEQSVQSNRGFADTHGVTLWLNERPKAEVLGDKDRLEQVLTNLLSNAVKFSGDSKKVEISIVAIPGFHRVSVRDFGPGIPDDFREKIFERFTQVDASDSREKGGTGLGLSICQAITERHDGRLWFDSEVGKGTTFFFEIPIFCEEKHSIEAMPTPDSRLRILVLEDDPDFSLLLDMIFRDGGYEPHLCANVQEARKELKTYTFAAMTLDIGLPDGNGLNFLNEIRGNDGTKTLPIVIVSAHKPEDKDMKLGSSIGVIDWITKPIDHDRLLLNIRTALGKTKAKRPQILHVEDELDVYQVISAVIDDFADSYNAPSLKQAQMMLEKNHYDLVILDLNLPDGSGEQLLPLLRHTKDHPATPVIVFSADEPTKSIQKAIARSLLKTRASNEELLETIRASISSAQPTHPASEI